MKTLLANPQVACYDDPSIAAMGAARLDDPSIAAMSAARLNEIGNLSVQQAVENAGRLSAMMGVRAAQTNPIEAHAIGALNRSAAGGDAQSNGLAGALAAMLINLSNVTPK